MPTKDVLKIVIDLTFMFLIVGFTLYIVLLVHSMAHWELPYVPTMRREKRKLRKYITVKKGSRVLDMGSGLGSMLIFFAKYPVSITGIEKRRFLAFLSRMRLKLYFWKKGEVQVVNKDFFEEDLSQYDIIYCFHIPRLIKKLEIKMKEELRKDTLLISYRFEFPLLKDGFEVEKMKEGKDSYFYMYRKKESKD